MNRKITNPLLLIILDGWGYRKEKDANAIALANKPNWDNLEAKYPHTLISGSGKCVGLPTGQMGNSEVGHLSMGAGRKVQQDLTKINAEISNGEFFQNPRLIKLLQDAQAANKPLHLVGLLSPGGVHSHDTHFHAVVELAARMQFHKLYIHAFLDGRDTPPRSAESSLLSLDDLCKKNNMGGIVSIVGRYYAMDRDKRWDRVHLAYDLLTSNEAAFTAPDINQALQDAYARCETDEFVQPTRIQHTDHPVYICSGDSVLFMNFRADRARELTECFINPNFKEFPRKNWPHLTCFASLAEYDEQFLIPVIYPPEPLLHIFGECIAQAGLRQLRIAETEKYAHVTFFFNGGQEKPFIGEDRILIPSPKVTTYDLQPEMSAFELSARLIEAIQSQTYDVIICNFANPDMIGHTGNLVATIKAIEVIDECLGKILAAQKEVGGETVITADHGNAELMYNHEIKQPHTAHTAELVPFMYIGRPATIVAKEHGSLCDIAPTLLYLLGLDIPAEMTGKPLLVTNSKGFTSKGI